MSYILDALRKSDQLRRRGTVPTFAAALPMAMAAPQRPGWLRHGVFWLLPIVIASIALGWFASVRTGTGNAPAPVAVAAPALLPAAGSTAVEAALPPVKAAPERAVPPMAAATLPAATVRRRSSPAVPAQCLAGVRDAAAGLPDPPATAKDVVSMSDLPASIRQGLPPMPVAVHAYSSKPADRLVSINGRLLHEGDELAAGLRLEQITPEGMVFSYRGYRFGRSAQ